MINFFRLSSRNYIARSSYSTNIPDFINTEYFHPKHWHVYYCTRLLVNTHDIFNISWGASIGLSALLVRTLVAFPFFIYSEKNNAKVMSVSAECKNSSHELLSKLKNREHFRNLNKYEQKLYFGLAVNN